MYNFVIGMASMYIRLLLHVCADLSLSANLVLFCFEPTPDATCCWCWRCPDAVAIVVVLGSVVYYCCCCCNYCSVCCCCHFTRCCCYSCCSGLWCCYCCCCLCKAQDAVKYSHKWGQKLKLKWRQSFSMHAQVCVFVCVSVGVSGKHPLIPSQGRVCHVKPGRVQKLKIMQIEVQLQHAECNKTNTVPDERSGMSSRQRWRKGSREGSRTMSRTNGKQLFLGNNNNIRAVPLNPVLCPLPFPQSSRNLEELRPWTINDVRDLGRRWRSSGSQGQ